MISCYHFDWHSSCNNRDAEHLVLWPFEAFFFFPLKGVRKIYLLQLAS